MDSITQFQQEKYIVVQNIIGQELVNNLKEYFKMHYEGCMYVNNNNLKFYADSLITENAFCWYAPVDFLLVSLQEKVENLTGLYLVPTYSFGRIYFKNAVMRRHQDRASCEISMTLNVSVDNTPWPIWVTDIHGNDKEIILNPGDAMIYRGKEIPHWRNPYTDGNEQIQFFLHWIDANGKYLSSAFDKRPVLGLPPNELARNDP
jgi:hypothetical protein